MEVIGEVIRERVRIKGQIGVLNCPSTNVRYRYYCLTRRVRVVAICHESAIHRPTDLCLRTQGKALLTADCSQPVGWVFLGIAAFGIIFGYFVMQKLTAIDVSKLLL